MLVRCRLIAQFQVSALVDGIDSALVDSALYDGVDSALCDGDQRGPQNPVVN